MRGERSAARPRRCFLPVVARCLRARARSKNIGRVVRRGSAIARPAARWLARSLRGGAPSRPSAPMSRSWAAAGARSSRARPAGVSVISTRRPSAPARVRATRPPRTRRLATTRRRSSGGSASRRRARHRQRRRPGQPLQHEELRRPQRPPSRSVWREASRRARTIRRMAIEHGAGRRISVGPEDSPESPQGSILWCPYNWEPYNHVRGQATSPGANLGPCRATGRAGAVSARRGRLNGARDGESRGRLRALGEHVVSTWFASLTVALRQHILAVLLGAGRLLGTTVGHQAVEAVVARPAARRVVRFDPFGVEQVVERVAFFLGSAEATFSASWRSSVAAFSMSVVGKVAAARGVHAGGAGHPSSAALSSAGPLRGGPAPGLPPGGPCQSLPSARRPSCSPTRTAC